jgi:tetratricopeptide (TPR) repeat protein
LLTVADLSRVNGDYQAAIDGYKKVLEVAPDNPDALAMIGVCYYAMGASNNSDKGMYQEGANYLQKYLSVAPEGHKYKKDVAEILDALKKENVTPQKVPTTPAKKRGGSI